MLNKFFIDCGRVGFGFLAIGSLFYYFYASNSGKIIDYAKHFNSLNFASRAYLDLIFKGI